MQGPYHLPLLHVVEPQALPQEERNVRFRGCAWMVPPHRRPEMQVGSGDRFNKESNFQSPRYACLAPEPTILTDAGEQEFSRLWCGASWRIEGALSQEKAKTSIVYP